MQAIFAPGTLEGATMPSLGLPSNATAPGWIQSAASYTNYGQPADYSVVPQFLANVSITYSYSIYPWQDRTHEYIQQGMLAFVTRHINQKFKLYCMAPIWKINIEAKTHYVMANNQYENVGNAELAEFQGLLAQHGESVLGDYHSALRRGTLDDNLRTIKRFYDLAQKPEYRYLTKFGILSHWNFVGSVLSKGESTGPATYLDMHSDTDIVYVVGCVLGERARVGNIWGGRSVVHPGTRLFLILKRVELANGKYGEFQWVPYASRTREYPPRHMTNYRDESGRTCSAFVLYVGVCTESMEKDPSSGQIEMATGLIGGVQQAYEAHGSLPSIQVQIGI